MRCVFPFWAILRFVFGSLCIPKKGFEMVFFYQVCANHFGIGGDLRQVGAPARYSSNRACKSHCNSGSGTRSTECTRIRLASCNYTRNILNYWLKSYLVRKAPKVRSLIKASWDSFAFGCGPHGTFHPGCFMTITLGWQDVLIDIEAGKYEELRHFHCSTVHMYRLSFHVFFFSGV